MEIIDEKGTYCVSNGCQYGLLLSDYMAGERNWTFMCYLETVFAQNLAILAFNRAWFVYKQSTGVICHDVLFVTYNRWNIPKNYSYSWKVNDDIFFKLVSLLHLSAKKYDALVLYLISVTVFQIGFYCINSPRILNTRYVNIVITILL